MCGFYINIADVDISFQLNLTIPGWVVVCNRPSLVIIPEIMRVGWNCVIFFTFLGGCASLLLSGLKGVMVEPISSSGSKIDLAETLNEEGGVLCIFGTYAADFNNIEYSQKLKHYFPRLEKETGMNKCLFIMNANTESVRSFQDIMGLDTTKIELCADPTGEAGRAFGCSSGWRPDDSEMSPYLKLFGMLWGLGAWATLPSVIGGYIGNPFQRQPWVTSALRDGQIAGRFPTNALEIDKDDVVRNKFNDLPLVGNWGLRPLELATLRLQNMMGISLGNWKYLKPDDSELQVLTQLGGCSFFQGGESIYEWRDAGICHVANFEDMIETILFRKSNKVM